MNVEEVNIWNKVILSLFNVLSRFSTGVNEENLEKPQSELQITRSKSEALPPE
jgi:hypothetical protein